MWNKIRNALLVVLVGLHMSNVTSVPTAYLLFAVGILFIIKYIVTKRVISGEVILLFLLWLVINIFAAFVFHKGLSFPRVFLSGFNYLIITYFILNELKINFFNLLEKYIFVLTCISIPLFLLNILFIDYFNALHVIFKVFTRAVLSESSPTYWSALFYTNTVITESGMYRNCGFMWEPGYFATTIIFAIIFNWLTRGVKINLRFIIYSVAIVTTLSTAGYIALFLLFLVAINTKYPLGVSIPLIILFVPFFYFGVYNKYDFLGDKIDYYIEDTRESQLSGSYSDAYGAVKYNRFAIVIYDINRVIRYPVGFGIHDRVSFDEVDVTGTNGITGMMRMWGVFIFIYFTRNAYMFFKRIDFIKIKTANMVLMLASIFIVFFAQNMQYNILLYLIILYPVVCKKRIALGYDEVNNCHVDG